MSENKLRVRGVGPAIYLLDGFGGAEAAYSLRRLSSSYEGPLIRVRRSSDNSETNIGFNENGKLDELALTNFVGANNGFVVTIYDQSGKGMNASWWQAVTQAKIVSSGVVEKHNGKPVINTNGITARYQFINTSYTKVSYKTLFYVGKVETLNSYNHILSDSDYWERVWVNSSSEPNTFGFYKHDFATPYPRTPISGGGSLALSGASLNQNLLYMNIRDMKLYSSYNNNPETLLGNWGSAMRAGELFGPTYGRYDGKFSEIILWNSDKSADREEIINKINSYYSIY